MKHYRFLKLLLVLFFVNHSCFNAEAAYKQNEKIKISTAELTVKQLVKEIEQQTDFLVLLNNSDVDVNQIVNLKTTTGSLDTLLKEVFGKMNVRFEFRNQYIVLSKNAVAQSTGQKPARRITGTVVDENNLPVAGANIKEKNTINGTITDVNGEFELHVSEGSSLLITYIGYTPRETTATGNTPLKIILKEDTQALDEVVIVGYGTQKRVNLTGAVNSISSKALESRAVTNANMALQGLAPNMNITRVSGMANSAPDINIRGFTSINGGSAFILLDNVPITSEELSRINPSDIENVSVLKDAASAAIYGARAAFGVVLITTKTAKSKKLTVDAEANVSIKSFENLPRMANNLPEWMRIQSIMAKEPNRFGEAAIEYARQRMLDPSLPSILFGPEEGKNPRLIAGKRWEYYENTDWFDTMLKSASPSQDYNVRISQKSDKLSYTISGGYHREDGMLEFGNDIFNRYNFRGNATYELTKWWKLGSNISYSRSNYDAPSTYGEDSWEVYRMASNYPERPIYNLDGSYTQDGGINVGALKDGGRRITQTNETQISFNTQIDILKDVWTVKGDANFRFTNKDIHHENLNVIWQNSPINRNLPGNSSVSENAESIQYSVFNIFTDFNKTFAEKHALHAMVGFNQEYFTNNIRSVNVDGLISKDLPTIQLATGNISKSQSISELALRGGFARLGYIFDNRYLLEMNGRYDGTSRFPKNDRFGFFPSVSAGWIVSNEKFFGKASETLQISNLKIRGSYGTLGNQSVSDYYLYIPKMGTGAISTILNGGRPVAITQPGTVSSELTWETVRTINGGIDLSLFNNKFDLSFDIYTRYTEDMLTKSRELPSIYGAKEPLANAADLKTNGWELSVGWRDAFNLGGSPFSYSCRFMMADSRAYITRFDNPTDNLGDYRKGAEIGELWGYVTEGYFKSDQEAAGWADQSAMGNSDNNYEFFAGDLKFRDLNNDKKINSGDYTAKDPGDMKIIGNTSTRFPYSIEATAAWKGFDLRLFFQGVGKRDAYPSSGVDGLFFWGIYRTAWANISEKNLDNWTQDNPNSYFPRLKPYIGDNGELSRPQTKYLQDASYLRFKNLTFGYTLPKPVTDKLHIDRLRVYFSGENLFTIHNIDVPGNDPERFNAPYYPFQRSFSLGLNLSF